MTAADRTKSTDSGGPSAADQLADWGFDIRGAWRRGGEWGVRIASDYGADHDTYYTGYGATLDEALNAAVEWWRPLAPTPNDGSDRG